MFCFICIVYCHIHYVRSHFYVCLYASIHSQPLHINVQCKQCSIDESL